MPPAALTSSTASCAPFWLSRPKCASAPVSAPTKPMSSGPVADWGAELPWAGAEAAATGGGLRSQPSSRSAPRKRIRLDRRCKEAPWAGTTPGVYSSAGLPAHVQVLVGRRARPQGRAVLLCHPLGISAEPVQDAPIRRHHQAGLGLVTGEEAHAAVA